MREEGGREDRRSENVAREGLLDGVGDTGGGEPYPLNPVKQEIYYFI